MADNVKVNPGANSNAVNVATDDIDGVHYPIYKQSYGTNGSQTPVSETTPLPVRLGYGDIATDAWGLPKVSMPVSLFHGLWTFDIPRSMWLVYEDGSEVAPASVTAVTSSNGAALIDTNGFTSAMLVSKRTPRYQPNRGHLYSTALWCPDSTSDGVRDFGLFTDDNGVFFRLKADGLLYAVVRSGSVETKEELIDTSGVTGFDVEKGNVYDIQFQWRGVGNYKFFINLTLVHTINVLGTVTALTLQNPALPAAYLCTNTTEDVTMHVGCVDITSEGGIEDRLQYFSVSHEKSTGGTGEVPMVSIYSPATINGDVNTRDIRLARVSASADAKVTINVYVTRDAAALTGESFAAAGNGSFIQVDTTASAVVPANARKMITFKVQANSSDYRENPDKDRIDFFVTKGDYIIVTSTGSNTTVSASIEWGEEI